jgi:multidrug efflux pump subunit AcrA (membrane-fusion protein)
MNSRNNISLWTMALVVSVSAILWGCGRAEQDGAPNVQQRSDDSPEISAPEADTLYQCPMHPHIIRHKPGSCPICGMDLVPVQSESAPEDTAEVGEATEATGATDGEHAVIRIAPEVARNVALRTERVERRALARDLRLNGKIMVDEDRVFSLTARIGGYVEKLAVASVGQRVERGQILLELYSPELVTAQQEFLQGGDAASGARERLLNWGVSPAFISRLQKTGQPIRLVPLVAPSNGTVTLKHVVKGQAVSPGMELVRIADLSEVWVSARLYQPDLAWIKTGAEASVRLRNLPGRDFKARVVFISPELDPSTRTAEIRLELKNTVEQDLRPEMFAEVRVAEESSSSALAVPSHALIRTGGRDVAMVALDRNRYQAREVSTGRETGEWIEILSGLEEGDLVVVNAQFLLDSESSLRAVVERIRNGSGSTPGSEGGHDH